MKERITCRVCRGGPLRDVLELGDFMVSDFVPEDQVTESAPLTLAECEKCKLVQLRHTLDRDRLYRNYWYLSGLNPSMVASLQDVVAGIEKRVELRSGDTVVDVGANDGTLLSLYTTRGLVRVGFDPAKNLAAIAERQCEIFVCDYFETSTMHLSGSARVITSIAMFYDLDDPHEFVAHVAKSLTEDGIWVVQMTDLVRMLRANAFDNICHEHLCYYSLFGFMMLCAEHGLRIFDVEFNDVNGGSLRAYVCRGESREHDPSVDAALQDEFDCLTGDALEAFRERVVRARETTRDFIHSERARGRTFHALGASTKGNTLLQYFGLGPDQITCAAEVNPAKFGLRTAGSNIPIVNQDASLAIAPDYYLVLPWHFIGFFVERLESYLERGGQLLVPLPEPTLYGYQSGSKSARRLGQE